jgi:hypothetical protein
MATVIPNEFTSYQLNAQEELEGALLTITQKQVIQNALSASATEKVYLDYDPANPQDFVQQEAYKQGMIAAYRFLLDASDAAEEVLNPPTLKPVA